MKIWISKDKKDTRSCDIWIYKPVKYTYHFVGGGLVMSISDGLLFELGIAIKPGECREYDHFRLNDLSFAMLAMAAKDNFTI